MNRKELIDRLNKSRHFNAKEYVADGFEAICLTAKYEFSNHFTNYGAELTDSFNDWLNDKGWFSECDWQYRFYLFDLDS